MLTPPELLLQLGASPWTKDSQGHKALDYAEKGTGTWTKPEPFNALVKLLQEMEGEREKPKEVDVVEVIPRNQDKCTVCAPVSKQGRQSKHQQPKCVIS